MNSGSAIALLKLSRHFFVRRTVRIAIFGLTMAATASNAASLTGVGYAQNFDSMGVDGTTPPTDWSLFTGPSGTSNSTWTSTISAAGVGSMLATTGALTATSAPTATNNNGYNAALSPSTVANRVLAISPTTVSGAALQLSLSNSTGAALTGLELSFDTVRFTSASSQNELPGYWLFYSLDGSTWANVTSLNPSAATVPNSVGSASTTGAFAFAAAVAPGASVLLRWVDDNAVQTSPDQIIGLDNVTIAPVPLPTALPLLLSALGGLGLMTRRRGRA